jgi:hypothetical protein
MVIWDCWYVTVRDIVYSLCCISFSFVYLIDFGNKVWEIVARSEPHKDVDPVDVGALIRCVHFLIFLCLCIYIV